MLAGGSDVAAVDSIIVSSAEYFRLHGGTNDGFLDALFRDALGRDVDPGSRFDSGRRMTTSERCGY
jgi:hypothetical protein